MDGDNILETNRKSDPRVADLVRSGRLQVALFPPQSRKAARAHHSPNVLARADKVIK
jgi:hypothetical protein